MSTLPPPHILVNTVSQVTIPSRMIAIILTTFSGIPKPNCYYSLIQSLIQHELLQHLLVVPVLKICGEKLPLQLLCTIVNTSSDESVLPKHRYFGDMKQLSNIDDPLEPLMINVVMYALDSDQVDAQCMQIKILPTTSMNSLMTQNPCQQPQF